MHVDPYRRYREGNILDLDHYRGPTLSRTLIRILRILLATWLAVLSTQVAVVSSREKKREPTLWVLRIEGDKQEYLVPVEVCQEYGLRAGQTISLETARRIAIDMGGQYTSEDLRKLEELGK